MEEYTDEQLYQGVEVRPGVFRTKKREFTPPKVMTGSTEGILPFPTAKYIRCTPQVMKVELDGEQDRRELDLED